MKLQVRAISALILGIALAAAASEKNLPQEMMAHATELATPQAASNKTQAQSVEPAPEEMKKETGAASPGWPRYDNALAVKEQTLEELRRELDLVKADLATRDSQAQFMAGQLAKREKFLRFQWIVTFSSLAVGAVMFLAGYFNLRANKRGATSVTASQV